MTYEDVTPKASSSNGVNGRTACALQILKRIENAEKVTRLSPQQRQSVSCFGVTLCALRFALCGTLAMGSRKIER